MTGMSEGYEKSLRRYLRTGLLDGYVLELTYGIHDANNCYDNQDYGFE